MTNFSAAAKVIIQRGFNKNATGPYEAIKFWNKSLAQLLEEEEAKQK